MVTSLHNPFLEQWGVITTIDIGGTLILVSGFPLSVHAINRVYIPNITMRRSCPLLIEIGVGDDKGRGTTPSVND